MSGENFNARCTKEKAPPNTKERALKNYFCGQLWKNLVLEGDPGFSPFVLTKLWGDRAGERSLAGVQFRLRVKDKPILLRFCPFCGVSFKRWMAPHLKKPRDAQKKVAQQADAQRKRLRESR
jgi:hypothetical protein